MPPDSPLLRMAQQAIAPMQPALQSAAKTVGANPQQIKDPGREMWWKDFSQRFPGQVPDDLSSAEGQYNVDGMRLAEQQIKSPVDLEKFRKQGAQAKPGNGQPGQPSDASIFSMAMFGK